jgi:acetolactate synthase I/II/III large subunit
VVNVAERLVALLEHAGVDVIFGVGGTHSLQLLGALERRSTVRYVAARNEQGAAYMAVGYARATRNVGVVLTSTGPGALNALSGIADAEYSSLPLLHITTWADHGTYSGGIHESPFQSDVLAGVGAGVEQVVDGNVDTPFLAAWERCSGSTPRPVTLEIYSRAWNAEADPASDSAPVPAAGSRGRSIPPAEAVMLDRVAAALDGAERPVIYAGGGVIRSGASAELMELAGALGAPVVTSYQGRGVATWDHELYLGAWGAEPEVHDLLSSSDGILVVGSKLSALSTSHWTLPLPGPVYRIDTNRIGHGHYADVIDIAVDAKAALGHLSGGVGNTPRGGAQLVKPLVASVRRSLRERSPIEASYLEALDAGLPPDVAISFDMNKASFWCMKYLPHRPEASHSFSSYLCMGSALPNAIGMSERGGGLSVAVVGDGGLQMSSTELATIAERQPLIAVVVLVDGAYGLLRDNGALPAVRGSRELGVTLWNPDFQALAAMYTMSHRVAPSATSLTQHLREVSGPTLIEVPQSFSRNW